MEPINSFLNDEFISNLKTIGYTDSPTDRYKLEAFLFNTYKIQIFGYVTVNESPIMQYDVFIVKSYRMIIIPTEDCESICSHLPSYDEAIRESIRWVLNRINTIANIHSIMK